MEHVVQCQYCNMPVRIDCKEADTETCKRLRRKMEAYDSERRQLVSEMNRLKIERDAAIHTANMAECTIRQNKGSIEELIAANDALRARKTSAKSSFFHRLFARG